MGRTANHGGSIFPPLGQFFASRYCGMYICRINIAGQQPEVPAIHAMRFIIGVDT